MENAELLNFSGRKTLQILTIYFFPTLPAQNTNQQKKVEKYIYLLCIFVWHLTASALKSSEEFTHGAGRRFEPGTYFAVDRRLQLIATLIPDKTNKISSLGY